MPVPRRRLRSFAKYAGLMLCVLIAAAWLLSRWWAMGAAYVDATRWYSLTVDGGGVSFYIAQPLAGMRGWYAGFMPGSDDWVCWLPEFGDPTGFLVLIPLWIPFLVVAIPAALLFYRDHLVPSGHCLKCRYDLRGNTTGLCPECGHAVANNQA